MNDSSFDSSNIIEQEEVFPINEHPNSGLNYIIKITNEWMNRSTSQSHFYFFPIGSITYHKSFPDNPKNFLLCFPDLIDINNIYYSYVPYLRTTQMFAAIIILKNRKLPCLKLTIMNHNFELIFSFLPYQFCVEKKPTFNLMNPPQIMLENMNLNSIISLNTLRNCLLIRENAGQSLNQFHETLLHLKRWALFKLIYSNCVLGCLNGTALAVMLACTFRKNIPATSVMGNLYIFFRHYIEMNWTKRTVCINLEEFKDNMRQLVMKDPHLMSPTNGVMTVLTPAMPHQNCTSNIKKLMLDKIIFQFREAFFILEKSTWKAGLNLALMQPITLMDFIVNAKTVKLLPISLILLSVFEDKHMLNYGVFCEFEELIKTRLDYICKDELVIPYPIPMNNIIVETKFRIHHHFFIFYGNNTLWSQRNPLQISEDILISGLNYTTEVMRENDNRLLSLNFDNLEKIVRVIYTDMREKYSLEADL